MAETGAVGLLQKKPGLLLHWDGEAARDLAGDQPGRSLHTGRSAAELSRDI